VMAPNWVKGAFYLSIGANGNISTNGISHIRVVFHWWKAYHYNDLEIFDGFRLSRSAFCSSTGANGTFGTNGIAVIRLVIHSWKASHYKELGAGRKLRKVDTQSGYAICIRIERGSLKALNKYNTYILLS